MIARRTQISGTAAAAALVMTLTAMPAARATTYTILETTPAVVSARTAGLNNLGQTVGNGQLWSGGVVVDLRPYFNPILNRASDFGTAWDINDAGDIAGETDLPSFQLTCGASNKSLISRLDATGLRTCVSTSNNSYGTRVNASGQIVGTDLGPAGAKALFWDPAVNRFVTLPSVDPPTANYRQWDALAINSSGEIVGWDRVAFPTVQPTQAVRWTTAGTPTALDLGNLGGAGATATGINDSGRIVGVSKTAALEDHAFLWVSGTISDIGTFNPSDINEADQIVGSQTLAGVTRAVLYESGTLTDLNTALPQGSGWVLESATQVNELGQISGKGTLNGTPTAFLLLPATAPLAAANLAATIAPNQNPYVSGHLTYSGTVTNLGPDPATGVVLSIGYPQGDVLASYSSLGTPPQLSRGSCRSAGDVYHDLYAGLLSNLNYYWCSIGALAVGETVTVSLDTKGPENRVSSRLAATLFSQQLDSVPGDNQVDLTVNNANLNATDLVLIGTDAPDPVLAGQPLTYTYTITNTGPLSALNSTFNALSTSPASNFVSVSTTQGSCSGTSSISCTLGALPASGTATVTIVVIPVSGSPLSRSASVSYAGDTNTANNAASVTTTVIGSLQADLSLVLADAPDPAVLGDTVTYTITATNNGPDAASNVTASGTLNSCSLGNLAPGASASCTRTVTATFAGALTRSMSVSATEPDPNSANNSATATTTVDYPPADLAIVMTDAPDPVLVGGTVTYTITATNNGPTAALNNVSASGTLGICNLGNLAVGASASCTRTVVAAAVGTLNQLMSVVAPSTSDPNSANNSATTTTTVNYPPADLALTLTDTPDPVTVGGTVTYTATVTNSGPAAASNVYVTGTLATCSLGTITSGASASCTRTAVASAAGTLSQTMSAAATESDPNPGNNSATASTTVLGGADLAVTITDSPDPVKKGARLTYVVVVRNGGPLSATGVALRVVLPANITFESKTSSQGTCSGTATVNCVLGSLGNGSSATVTIKIKPQSTGTATSTASVTGSSTDPNGANNAATASTTVKK